MNFQDDVLVFCLGLWIKGIARDAATERTREMVRAELVIQSEDLLRRIAKTYLRSAGSVMTGAEAERRIQVIVESIAEVGQYVRELKQELTEVSLAAEIAGRLAIDNRRNITPPSEISE